MKSKNKTVLFSISEIILKSQQWAFKLVNAILLETFCKIAPRIIGKKQPVNQQATYGKAILKNLTLQLPFDFSKQLSYLPTTNIHTYYIAFSAKNANRQEFRSKPNRYAPILITNYN